MYGRFESDYGDDAIYPLIPIEARPHLAQLRREKLRDRLGALLEELEAPPAPPHRSLVERKHLGEPSGSFSAILFGRYDRDPEQIVAKTFAVATFGTTTKAAVTNLLIPGSASLFRNPVRHVAISTVTPGGGTGVGRIGGFGTIGGGGGGGAGGIARLFRCPAGFQNGGRFSNRQLNNCGQQLFAAPSEETQEPANKVPGARAATEVQQAGNIARATVTRVDAIRGEPVGSAQMPALAAAISREAEIPHVGKPNQQNSVDAVTAAVNAASSAAPGFTRLVRRDGVALNARVNTAKLAGQRNNADMTDGTIVTRLESPDNIGKNEVGLFGSGIASVRFIAPGGHELRLDRKRPISPANARELNRQWATIQRGAGDQPGTAALQQLADRSRGRLAYSENFNDIQNPNESLRIARNGTERTVPRWVFETFYADNAPGRTDKQGAWKAIGAVNGPAPEAAGSTVDTLAEAKKVLTGKANLSDVPAGLRDAALKDAKVAERSSMGAGRTLVERRSGERYVAQEMSPQQSLAEKVAADLQTALGVATPEAQLGVTANGKRTLYTRTPDSVVSGGTIASDAVASDASPDSLARIAMADFLLGREGRQPGTLAMVKGANKTIAVPSGGSGVLLADASGGPSKEKLVAAISRKPEEVLTAPDGGQWTRSLISNPEHEIRRIRVATYENMLKALTEFDWSAYSTRLSADGALSTADKQNLEIMRALVDARAKQLRESRKTIFRIMQIVSD